MTRRPRSTARRQLPPVLAGAALALGLTAVLAPAAHAVTLPGDGDFRVLTIPDVEVAVDGTSPPHVISTINAGSATITDWTVTVEVSPLVQATILDFEDVHGTCDITGQTITCTGAELAGGEIFSIRLQYTGVTPGVDISTVTASAAETDPNPDNNTLTGSVTVTDDAALSGDWGTSGSDLLAPGDSRYYDLAFTCLSAAGCDYAPGLSITDQAIDGGSFGAGTNQLYINGTTPVGSCTVTTTDVDCQVTASGRAAQGDVLSALDIAYRAAAGTPADTLMFTQTLAVPAGWVGNDTSNDTYPISTPPEVGAPIVSWQGAAALAGIVLIGGTGVMLRRRHLEGQNAA